MPTKRTPVAKRTNLPTINEIPPPTYDLLTQSNFFERPRDYVTCVLKLHIRPVHLVCMPRKYKGPEIVRTDIVGAHFTRLIEHEKMRGPGKLRNRFVEALDLAVAAELRHRKRKDWFVRCKKTLDAEGLEWRLVEALDVTNVARLPNPKIFKPRWITTIIQNLCRRNTSQVCNKYNTTSPTPPVNMSSPISYQSMLRDVISSFIHVGFAIGFWIFLGLELTAGILAFGLLLFFLASPFIYCAGGFDNPEARANKKASANNNTNRDLEANIGTTEAAPLAPPTITADESQNDELPVEIYEFNNITPADSAAPIEAHITTDSEDSGGLETYYEGDVSDLEELDPLLEEPSKDEGELGILGRRGEI